MAVRPPASGNVLDDSVLNEDGFEEEEDQCNLCGSTQNLLRCGGCRSFWYCSKEHQRQDWPSHKPICLGMQKQSKPPAAAPVATTKAHQPMVAPHVVAAAAKKAEDDEEYPEKLPPGYRTAQDQVEDDEEEGEVASEPPGLCGIHPSSDTSQYLHALNNMAGCHKIDLPLGESEQFDEDDDVWTTVDQDHRLGNQLLIHKGALKRREKGTLGTGVRVNGKVSIGVDESGAEISNVFVGKGEEEFIVKKQLRLSPNITLLPGARVTSHMIIRGPLKYGAVEISADGGIHASGSVFSQDGTKRDQGLYYREECIEALLAKAGKS